MSSFLGAFFTQESTTVTQKQVEELLSERLSHYARSDRPAAVKCWRKVLALRPGEERAQDFIMSAGADATLAPCSKPEGLGDALQHDETNVSPEDRKNLELLVREKHFNKALKLAFELRLRVPQDEALSRAIQLLKERLFYDDVKRIGFLDRIPRIDTKLLAQVSLRLDERLVLRLVDGITTYSDITESCRLGPSNTTRILADLLERRVLESDAEGHRSSITPSRSHAAMGENEAGPFTKRFRKLAAAPSTAAESPESALREQAIEAYLAHNYQDAHKHFAALLKLSPDVEAAALMSNDGLMIASVLPQHHDDVRIAGMSSTLLSLGTRAAVELERGELQQVLIRGTQGFAVMVRASEGTMLLVLTSERAMLGLVFLDMSRAVKAIDGVL